MDSRRRWPGSLVSRVCRFSKMVSSCRPEVGQIKLGGEVETLYKVGKPKCN